MRNFGIETVLAIAATLVASAAAHAQTVDAGALFGQAAHAYFSGNSSRAESYLSSALALNPDDPRLYYFRGLALLRLGRGDEARGDMLAGAQHEARQPGRYGVGMALQRVQGAERLLLEQFRRQARSEAQHQRRQISQARFEQSSVEDDRALHRPITVSLDEFLPGAGPRLSAAGPSVAEPQPIAPAADIRPISSENAEPASQPTAPPPEATTGDPFIDDPAPEGDSSGGAPRLEK